RNANIVCKKAHGSTLAKQLSASGSASGRAKARLPSDANQIRYEELRWVYAWEPEQDQLRQFYRLSKLEDES
ncbi:MAG: hypothetical protein V2I33_25990, partial [Kangiellaceae bacterium]|nr:hypothetical protein [Kangiellaceae bacterium]